METYIKKAQNEMEINCVHFYLYIKFNEDDFWLRGTFVKISMGK